ncbi:MAG: aspartate-semialdehyde dehydrogenase [Actinomycetota bacterium]|nr:aspartate-semialdehyde dehydrogenase [Actinomycetota bacterium]
MNVAIVGATGMVGIEMQKILDERNFPVDSLRLLASERSRGRNFSFRGKQIPVEVLSGESFLSIDIALFSAGASISKEFAPIASERGAAVIDNSSAFRMDPDVPLIVPEVNPDAAFANKGIIANPNCSTIQLVVALAPLHRRFVIKRVVVTTFQSVSGTGKEAVEELKGQVRQIEEGKPVTKSVYPHQIAYNCLPHIDEFLENGYTKEEMKMVNETRKIMGIPDLPVTATTVRVPVFVGHSESVNIEFEKRITPDLARQVLNDSPGIEVVDEPEKNLYPVPIHCVGKDATFVGRIRLDFSRENSLNMWIVSDNLRKGAALNAIQIAELLIKSGNI